MFLVTVAGRSAWSGGVQALSTRQGRLTAGGVAGGDEVEHAGPTAARGRGTSASSLPRGVDVRAGAAQATP